MSEVVYTVGEAFALSLAPIPANATLPAEPVIWAVDNPALAALNTEVSPPTVTLLAAGTVTISGTDGAIVGSLSVTVQPLPATGATVVLTPVTAAPAA